jgi:hypothetical protein
MSRVGKYPVTVPAGVQVALVGRTVVAKGKNGELSLSLTEEVDVVVEGGLVAVSPRGEDRRSRTMWGTTRSLIQSMVKGVSTGFSRSSSLSKKLKSNAALWMMISASLRYAKISSVSWWNLGLSRKNSLLMPCTLSASSWLSRSGLK